MRFQMPEFAELDKNKDKKISKEEFPSQFPPQAFDRMDENRDGFLDEKEFEVIRSRFAGMGGGAAPERTNERLVQRIGEQMARFMDGNTDGKVSKEEYARVLQLFESLDKDKNTELSADELNSFFQVMSEISAQATGGVDINNLFRSQDKNKDGKLSTEEMTNEKLFKSLDLNKDGSVTREEAESALKQINDRSRQKTS